MKISCIDKIHYNSGAYGKTSYATNDIVIKQPEPKLEQLQRDAVSFSGKLPNHTQGSLAKRLFHSVEAFQKNLLERLLKYKEFLPEKLYSAVEKNVSSGSFTLGETVKGYYAGMKDCKTLTQLKEMYPEFADVGYNPSIGLKKILKNNLPQDVCNKARSFATKDEQINHIMSYFENITSAQAKNTWPAYPDILKIEKEISQEVANGKFLGNPSALKSTCLFNNPVQPLVYNLINPEVRDKVILNYLREYYAEGKTMKDITPIIVNDIPMTPVKINNYFGITSDKVKRFRAFVTNADKEASLYKATTDMTKSEISSAVLNETWTRSWLRTDIAAMTQKTKPWSGMRSILYKMKYADTYMYPPELLIDKYLLLQYSSGRISMSGNPFAKYEVVEGNTAKIQKFINWMYNNPKLTMDEETLLRRAEFQKFKQRFDIEAMKKSFEIAEEYYKNVFFKNFWTPERIERFTVALKETYSEAKHNIEVTQKILTDAMSQASA